MLRPAYPHLLEIVNVLLDAAHWLETAHTQEEMDYALSANIAAWLALAALAGDEKGLPEGISRHVPDVAAYVQEELVRRGGMAPPDVTLSRVAALNLAMANRLAGWIFHGECRHPAPA